MKIYNVNLFINLFFTVTLMVPNAFAEDYTTWSLPEGSTARLGKGEITGNIAFSPDGNRLAVASSIGIWIYDARPEKEKEFNLLTGHTRQVTAIAFSPDGRTLASGSKDETVRLWDVALGSQQVKLTEQERALTAMAFSPDGKMLATGNGVTGDLLNKKFEIRLWNLQTAEHISLVGHTNDITSVAFSPDGNTLASSSREGAVFVWDLAHGKNTLLLTEHKRDIIFVGFSSDGQTIATGSRDTTVKLWNVETGILNRTIKEYDGMVGITSVAYSHDGTMIATGGHNVVRLWEAATGQYITTIKTGARFDYISNLSVAFSPDSKTLATASEHNELNLWNLQEKKHRATMKGHFSRVTCLTFSPNGKTIASGNNKGEGFLWDAKTGEQKATLKGHSNKIQFIAYTPDGNTIITGDRNSHVKLWEVRQSVLQTHTRKPASSFNVSSDSIDIDSMAYSSDGKLIATIDRNGKKIYLWNGKTGRKVGLLDGKTHKVRNVVFSPDGSILADAGNDLNIQLWDLKTKQVKSTLELHGRSENRYTGIAFSPEGVELANVRGEDTVQLWDVATGKEITLMKMPEWGVTKVLFSPNGAIIATGFHNGTIHLWSRHTQEHLVTYKGHTEGLTAMAFSPDSDFLASSGHDGTILIWQLQ